MAAAMRKVEFRKWATTVSCLPPIREHIGSQRGASNIQGTGPRNNAQHKR